jgi:hypothetical protein
MNDTLLEHEASNILYTELINQQTKITASYLQQSKFLLPAV